MVTVFVHSSLQLADSGQASSARRVHKPTSGTDIDADSDTNNMGGTPWSLELVTSTRDTLGVT